MITKILRVLMLSIFLGAGGFLGQFIPLSRFTWAQDLNATMTSALPIAIGIFLGLILGILLVPWLVNRLVITASWVEQKLQKTPTQDIIGGVIGLLIGLVIAVLLGTAFEGFRLVGTIVQSVGALFFGYLGLSLGIKKKEDLLALFSLLPKFGKDKDKSSSKLEGHKGINDAKILDTSVIIDGRIADIVRCGFIEGTLVIPGFVLEELRHIADSSDLLKRNRGRRGLDILNLIRKELSTKVHIYEGDFEDIGEVDSKLVKLAQAMKGQILTNDFNLNKVAELQGVKVLNINELANAVKPVVLPGEEMVVQVVKDGKEAGQGVGYLDDGTMIVVEGGKKYMGQTIAVAVTSVLQTAAGRMIFAKPKGLEKKSLESNGQPQFNEVNAIG